MSSTASRVTPLGRSSPPIFGTKTLQRSGTVIVQSSSEKLGWAINLAAGNFFGSNMTNIALLGILDLTHRQTTLLRRVAINHSLTAALATVLMLVAVIAMVADIDISIGWVGAESLMIIGLYIIGMMLVQRENKAAPGPALFEMEPAEDFPSLRKGFIGFIIAAAVLIAAGPQLVNSSIGIAEITGLGTGFVGTALLSFVTSLPELIASLAAVRLGAFDMAVGNLLGSSVFNMFSLAIADFFLLDGSFLSLMDPNFVLVALLAMLLTNMALMGNLARVERKFLFFDLDSLAILLVYLAGMYLVFLRGVGI